MKPLLISGFGTTINVDKRKLIINNPLKKGHFEFYPHQIDYDSIIIDGHTGNISFEAIRWLTKHDINITMLNWNGNLLACINPKEPNNGRLRVKQYAKYLDSKERHLIASKIVEEKVDKSLLLLRELSRYYNCLDIDAIEKAFKDEHDLNRSPDINDLRTFEGRIASVYWDNLSKIFNELYPEFHFHGRKNKTYSWNMNASDEINALLNYGYAILESLCRKQINTVGLDACVGFVHEMDRSKTPLVYDIQELGRWIIDLSVIELLEGKKLKKSDFIVTENYHVRLTPNTAKMLIDAIRQNFNSKAGYKGKNYTYENIMLDNVQKLTNHILDKNPLKYEIPMTKIDRNDEIDIQDKLVKMTSIERRKLGINRSTLWYIQKHINEGKKIELYEKVMAKVV